MIVAVTLALVLQLEPYAGPPLSGSVPGTAKFGVRLRGAPGATVRLRATNVPAGYLATFCTNRVCAPRRVTLVLPHSGRQTIELQYVGTRPAAPPPRLAEVAADGARAATLPFARATRS